MIATGDGEIPKNLSFVPVECKAGSLVLIHNSVVHKSEKNRSAKSRFVFAFHVIDGVAKYDELNWLQVPPGEEGGTEFSKLYSE
jgi:ectoine hydroxylase-related dioxygenase (phytanoyl-CoA dioxygenase family)